MEFVGEKGGREEMLSLLWDFNLIILREESWDWLIILYVYSAGQSHQYISIKMRSMYFISSW